MLVGCWAGNSLSCWERGWRRRRGACIVLGGGFCPSQGTPRSRKPTWPGNPMCKGQQRGLVGLQVNFSSTLWREELRERSANHLLLGLSGAGSQGCVGAGTARFGAAPPAAHTPMGSAAPCCTAGSPRDGGRGCGAAPHRGSRDQRPAGCCRLHGAGEVFPCFDATAGTCPTPVPLSWCAETCVVVVPSLEGCLAVVAWWSRRGAILGVELLSEPLPAA